MIHSYEFIINEIELGPRVAHAIDEKDSSGWDALDDLSYIEWIRNSTDEDDE